MFLKSLYWICYNIVSVWFFGCEACGLLGPWPGIEPVPCALEGKVLTTGLPGKSLSFLCALELSSNRPPTSPFTFLTQIHVNNKLQCLLNLQAHANNKTNTKKESKLVALFLSANLHSEESSQSGKFIILSKFIDYPSVTMFPIRSSGVRILTGQQMIDIYQFQNCLVHIEMMKYEKLWNTKALILFDLNNYSLTPFVGQAMKEVIAMKWQSVSRGLKPHVISANEREGWSWP